MNTKTIITRAIGFALLFSMAACQKKETANRGPSPALSTDTDLGHGYVRRDGAIHFIGGGITGTGDNATRIDMPSPMLLKKVVMSKFGPFKTAEGLDVASFEALSEVYTRDKKRVWYNYEIQREVDPATVKCIEGGPVYRDKNSVFYQYDTIAGADPSSFKHIGSGYYADRERVYWCSTPIPGADPANFEVMGDSFIAKDSSRIYRSGEPLPGYDVASFELILHNEAGFQIFSDKNGIHLNKMTFPRSKPGKAEVIDDLTVKVGNLVHTVSAYQYTPVTVFNEDGKLRAEAPCYEPESGKWLGMITAEISGEGLKDIRTIPLPGQSRAPKAPEWQLRAFTRSDLVERMVKSGKLLKSTQNP